jgi:hypothetical protein
VLEKELTVAKQGAERDDDIHRHEQKELESLQRDLQQMKIRFEKLEKINNETQCKNLELVDAHKRITDEN